MKKRIIIITLIIFVILALAYYYFFIYGSKTNSSNYSKQVTEKGNTILLKAIPDNYYNEISHKGKVIRIDYKTSDNLDKYTYVYLPYGYNENDKETKYNVFYLLHGGGGSAETYFGGTNGNYYTNVIDNMIENKDIEPMIIVTPTFYDTTSTSTSVSSSATMVEKWHNEVLNDLIPSVELKLNTYLESDSKSDIEKTRDHRGYGGFSMGSVSTWYELIYDLNYFKYFLPMSGDCWVYGNQGGASQPKRTAEYLDEVLSKSKYKDDFYLYAVTGSDDIAYNALSSQMNAIKEYTKNFKENDNYNFSVLEGGVHDHAHADRYVYDILPLFWR